MNLTAAPFWPLRISCGLILAVILAAGLWPFRDPPNQVEWLRGRNGVRLAGRGVVYAAGPRRFQGPPDGPCTFEIWLRPGKFSGTGTIVEFYNPAAPTEFSLFQEGSSLGFRLHNQRNLNGPHFYDRLGGIFASGQPEFLTIASNSKTTAVYVNGLLTKTMPDYPLTLQNLQGQLVAGTLAGGNDDWSGELLGLAAYGRELTAGEIARRYETWTTTGRPESLASTANGWLYLFDEGRGSVVHDALGGGIDLHIPARYTIVRPHILGIWRPHRADWRDLLLNVAGFVPFGFFFCAWFSSRRSAALPAVVTILFGMSISFGMEAAQAYLPGRTSSMTDLVTNTLGVAMGACLYQLKWARALAARTRLV